MVEKKVCIRGLVKATKVTKDMKKKGKNISKKQAKVLKALIKK